MSNTIIELKKVSYAYSGGRSILEEVDFVFTDKDRIGLIGPNGRGKTTLFYLVMGLLKPLAGKIEIFGKAIANERDYRNVRARIGFLFQNSDDQLFCPTVLEDVAFGPLNLGKSPREATAIVRHTLALLGIADFEKKITHHLSQGEKKLVALATVLAMNPEVLILDEPSANLDAATTERIMTILHSLDLPCIITSHDFDFLNRTTGTLYHLENGKILPVEEGTIHSHLHIHNGGKQPHEHSDLLKRA